MWPTDIARWIAGELSVVHEPDFKPEHVAVSNGILWGYCCSLLCVDEAHANAVASNLGSATFRTEWFGATGHDIPDPADQHGAARRLSVGRDDFAAECELDVKGLLQLRGATGSMQVPLQITPCLRSSRPQCMIPKSVRFDCTLCTEEAPPRSKCGQRSHIFVGGPTDGVLGPCLSGPWQSQASAIKTNSVAAEHPSVPKVDGSLIPLDFVAKRRDGIEQDPRDTDHRNGSKEDKDLSWDASPPMKRTLSLDSLIAMSEPVKRQLQTGARIDEVFAAFEPFIVDNLCQDFEPVGELHEATVEALKALPTWQGQGHVEGLRIYTDGAFESRVNKAGWAVVVLGHCAGQWFFLGYLADEVKSCGSDLSLGHEYNSAHVAEVMAMFYALCVVCANHIPTEICYDAVTASEVTQCKALGTAHGLLAGAACDLWNLACCLGCPPGFRHVRAHTGDPMNEMADRVAGAACRGSVGEGGQCLRIASLVRKGQLGWMWMCVTDPSIQLAWPRLRDDGILADELEAWKSFNFEGVIPGVPSSVISGGQHVASDTVWTLRIASYNANSVKAESTKQCIDAAFHNQNFHLIGIQESRCCEGPRTKTEHYTCFNSPSDGGQLGCQLWVNHCLHVGLNAEGSPVHWDPKSAVVLHATNRLLAVCINAGRKSFSCVVAHSPVDATSAGVLEAWWLEISSVFDKIPRNSVPLLMIDANARMTREDCALQLSCQSPNSKNASYFAELIKRHELEGTASTDDTGQPVFSWRSPCGSTSLIDFVVFPKALSDGAFSLGQVPGVKDADEFDHFPVGVLLSWRGAACQGAPRVAWDRARMRTAQGKLDLENIFASAPVIAWQVHPDLHLHLLNGYLFDQLASHFPLHPQRPRSRHISDLQWSLIGCKRGVRRIMHRARLLLRKEALHAILHAWKSTACKRDLSCRRPGVCTGNDVGRRLRSLHFLQARCCKLVRQLGAEIRNQAHHDVAEHVRLAFQVAREQGPAALASELRHFTRCGRKYKTINVARPLRVGDATITEHDEILKALERAFAVPERGQEVPISELVNAVPSSNVESFLDLRELPGLSELARGFLSLRNGSAAGSSTIPPELYRGAAIAAARVHLPIIVKAACHGQLPFLWRGGRAAAIPKPGKPLSQVTAWRSIAIHEAASKGLSRALRSRLTASLRNVATPGQHGTLPGQRMSPPSLTVRLFVKWLHKNKKAGSILYVDGKSAYYAVFREFLFQEGCACEAVKLADLVDRIADDDQERNVVTAVVASALLDEAGVHETLKCFLRTMLTNTWFSTNLNSVTAQRTASGTVPGTPLADLLFAFVQSKMLRNVEDEMEACGLNVRFANGSSSCPTGWADDIALTIRSADALCVVDDLRKATQIFEAQSRATGVLLNFGADKTAATCVLRGRNSKRARQLFLQQTEPKVHVPLKGGGSAELLLVEDYKHLGGIVDFSGSPEKDLKSRRRHSVSICMRLRRTVLWNNVLTTTEKRHVFRTQVLSAFLFGSGGWMLLSKGEQQAFNSAVMAMLRIVCRPISGHSCKLLSDKEVCALLELPSPSDLHSIELMRALMDVAEKGPGFLWDLAWHEFDWLHCAFASLQHAVKIVGCECELGNLSRDSLTQLQSWSHQLRHVVKKFGKLVVAKSTAHKDDAIDKAMAIASCESSGGIALHLDDVDPSASFRCGICSCGFKSAAALSAHLSKSHGVRGRFACVGGSVCARCMVDYKTTRRLIAHVRQVEECRLVYTESDIGAAEPFEAVKSQSLRAWKPPVAVQGPRCFWSTLSPAASGQNGVCSHLVDADELAHVVNQKALLELETLKDAFGDAPTEAWAKKCLRWCKRHPSLLVTKLVEDGHPCAELLLCLVRACCNEKCAHSSSQFTWRVFGHTLLILPMQ